MHDSFHNLIPPAAGFSGSVIMMTFLGQMPTRKWVAALGTGAIAPYFGVPAVMGYLHNQFSWLPKDGGVEGLVGFFIGLSAIFLIGALANVGKRFETNPTDLGSLK